MKRSLSSILAVVISLFVAFLGTWVYLRIKSDGRPLKTPFDHAFLPKAHDGKRQLLMLRASKPADLENLPSSTAAFTTAVWLDVRLGGEGQMVVSTGELLPAGATKGKPIEIATKAECREAGLFELSDFYKPLENRLAVLNLIARRPGLSEKILEELKAGGPLSVESVLLQSESDGILKELREKQPKGLYGASQATLIQMEILGNLQLQGLIDLKADVLVSSTEEQRRGFGFTARVRPSTLEEAHRRGLKRYAGPARTVEIAQELLNAGYDGVMIENGSDGTDVFAATLR